MITSSTDPKHRSTAVTYSRVSSTEQEREGYSIPAQQKLLTNYAIEHGITVARDFVDVETAKRAGRSGFGEMITFFKRNSAKCRILLVEKTDRLYRNLKDYVTLDELDLEVHFAKEGLILSRESRSSEKFMHGIKVLMAKNYIDNLSEETRKGMLEKAEQGIWPSYAPLGYKNVEGERGKRVIVPDPELAPLVTRLYELYSDGSRSLKELAAVASVERLGRQNGNKPMATATVHKILRSLVYTGDFEWNGRVYRGIHAPLVTKDLWERVQAALDGRCGARSKKASRNFPFSGLITCGHCGCALVGEIKKGTYVYYHCTAYKGKCPEPYTRQEVLEAEFSRLLRSIVIDAEVIGWVSEALRRSHTDEKRYHCEAVTRLRTEYTRLQNRLDAMYEDRLDGRVDVGFFDRKAQGWRSEQSRILRSIEEHQTANQSYMEEGIQLLELARRAHELFEQQPPAEKRRLLNFVLSNCSWKDGKLTGTFRQPFDMLALANGTAAAKVMEAGCARAGVDEWLPGMDSNHDSRLQRPLSYH
jgi:site-specific DNA recombinase